MTADRDADKATEFSRYEGRARIEQPAGEGSGSFEPHLRAPYRFYEESIARIVRPEHEVLELGAGTGVHTGALLRTGARVTTLDISPAALDALAKRHPAGVRLRTQAGDMEALPFPDGSFDVVACAGALSYGDPATVDAGVRRVLRPGGAVIFVDSLNHNPIYRLNRWSHYLRGHRTRSTLLRMPTLGRIQSIAGHFEKVEIRFFGGLTWAMPLVARIAGPVKAASLSDAFDRMANVRRSAFKFVLVAQGRQ